MGRERGRVQGSEVTSLDDFDLHRDQLDSLAERVTALQEEIALLRLNVLLSRERIETAARIFDNAQEAQ